MSENIICVIPVNSELLGIPHVPNIGSIQIPCQDCGSMCWINQNQIIFKRENEDSPLICTFCIIEKSKTKEINQ
jgi:hypothetical protein